jgi:hypothetical protein
VLWLATAAHRLQVSVAVACLQCGHQLLHGCALLLGDVQPPGGAVDGVHEPPLDGHRGQGTRGGPAGHLLQRRAKKIEDQVWGVVADESGDAEPAW